MRCAPLLAGALGALALIIGLPNAAGAATPVELLLDEVNALRASAGAPALITDPLLTASAAAWAQNMTSAQQLSHQTLNPSAAAGLQGENVGRGADIGAVFQAFASSPTHRANIVSARFAYTGVAVMTGPNGDIFVAQEFAQHGTAGASDLGVGGASLPAALVFKPFEPGASFSAKFELVMRS